MAAVRKIDGFPIIKVADWMPIALDLLGIDDKLSCTDSYYLLANDCIYNEKKRLAKLKRDEIKVIREDENQPIIEDIIMTVNEPMVCVATDVQDQQLESSSIIPPVASQH